MNVKISEISSPIIAHPGLSERVQSTFIDTLFIVALMFVFASWLERYENALDWIRIVLFFSLWAVYEPLSISLGGTLGNYLKGIRVRKYGNETKKINFFQAFLRTIIKITLGWTSFLTIHTNKEKKQFMTY